MKKTILTILTLIFLFTSVFAQREQKKIALVIGNSNYQHAGSLTNPINDANLMTSTLKDLGFEVTTLTDATLSQMQEARIDFTLKIQNYDVALFYYAGHGIEVDGTNFLIPVDAQLNEKIRIEYEAFDVNDISKSFSLNSQNTNIMILDACRNNPFRAWMRGGNRGFKAINNQVAGTIIAFAAKEGEPALDKGTGNNGLYTEKLVEQMKQPQTINEVFQNTRKEVLLASNNAQCPQEWNMLTGNFWFVYEKNNQNSYVAHNNSNIIQQDISIQENVEYDNTLYPVYIGEYPNEKFGFIDQTGKLLVDYIYDDAGFFHEGLARVGKKINDKMFYGFINEKGDVAIGIEYNAVSDYGFSDGLCFFELGSRKGFLNKEGVVAFYLPNNITKANDFSDGLSIVTSNSQFGIIDKNGNYTFALQDEITFEMYGINSNNLLVASKNGKWGFVDKYGNEKISFIYDNVNVFSEGFAAVVKDGLLGFVNTSGEMVIDANFYADDYYYTRFSEGLCAVRTSKNIWKYIDINGENAFKNKTFTGAGDFHNGKALIVTLDGETKILLKNGSELKTDIPLDNEYCDLKDKHYSYNKDIIQLSITKNGTNSYTEMNTGKVIWQSKKGYNWCFQSYTLIETQNGGILIKDIKQGMEILSFNPKTKQTEIATVKELQIHTDTMYQLTKITFINNNLLYASTNNDIILFEIEATENHPILTTTGLKEISEINETDTLLYYSDFHQELQECTILNISRNNQTVNEVYNIILENGNLYIANGLIASPKCPFVYVKNNGSFEKIDEILKNQMTSKLDKYNYLNIPYEMVDNRKLTVKISEEKEEISYLDHIYLQVGNKIITPICEKNILKKIQDNDNEYYQLNNGEFIELQFKLPKNIDKYEKIQLVAKGYYEPINYVMNE